MEPMSKALTCPSGMRVSVRGMKAKEISILQDRKLAKSGQLIDRILGACIESFDDVGPYRADSGRVSLDDMLLGDKFFILLGIRSDTFGASLSLPITCDSSDCELLYDAPINLDELEVRKLEPHAFELLRAGKPMTCRIPSTGALVTYRLATGRDDKLAARARDDQDSAIAMVASRIISIEGVETQEEFAARAKQAANAANGAARVDAFKGVRAFLEDLPMGDFFALIDEMEKNDCGVNVEIEVQCPKCEHLQKEKLQLGPNFWKPTKR